MKNLLILFFILVSYCAAAQTAPTQAKTPFKKANTIIILTTDSASVALKKFGSILVSKGYIIKKLDKDFNTLETDPKSVRQGAFPMTMSIRSVSVPGGIALSAELVADMRVISPNSEHTVVRVICLGKEATGNFKTLQDLALAYPGGELRYTLQ
jgi:hypothetical protein